MGRIASAGAHHPTRVFKTLLHDAIIFLFAAAIHFLKLNGAEQGSRICFRTGRLPKFQNSRNHISLQCLTLRISFDDGKSWKRKILIDSSPDAKGDFTAYSDLVKMAKNKIGVLYERHNYKEIVFTVIDWARKRD